MNHDPWRFGLAIAVTTAIAYTLCAVAYALSPDRAIDFLNAVFHGLDFHKLGAPLPFSLRMFVYPLVVFTIWSFVIGAIFALLNAWLGKSGR